MMSDKTLSNRRGSLVVASMVVMLAANVCAAADESRSGAELVRDGNEHLAAKRYREALVDFDSAQEKLPDSAEVAYDRGIALYRLGRFDEAETAFQDALKPDSPKLEAKAKYNLGRCSHAAAMAEQQDLKKAIDGLGRAIGFYKDALQLRPDDQDAQKNAEIAERLQSYLKKRLAQQKEQEKKESTSQPGDEKNDDEKQDGDQQQGEDRQGDQDKQQQSDKQNEEQDSKDRKPSSQPNEEESATTQQSEKPPEEPTTQSTTQPNEEATTQPMMAESQPASQPENEKEAQQRMSIEQAMRMLQEARDAELKRREQKRAEKMRRRGRIPVDKDW